MIVAFARVSRPTLSSSKLRALSLFGGIDEITGSSACPVFLGQGRER